VTIVERTLEDLRKMQKYDRVDEKPFEAVAALSELTERAYELLARPIVRQLAPEWVAKALRELHPLRVQRWAISDYNPLCAAFAPAAAMARAWRRPRQDDNAMLPVERFASEAIAAGLDLHRDLRDAAAEGAFFQVYGNMLSLNVADQQRAIRRATRFDPRSVPAVRQVLDSAEEAGAIEGFVRIGLLIAKAGSGKRKLSSMERVRELVAPAHLLDAVSEDEFRSLMHEETIIVEFEPDRAKRALPRILRTTADRRHAHDLLDGIAAHHRLDERQQALAAELRQLLPLPRKALPAPRGARGRASAKQSTASRRGGRARRAGKTG
jgi:hypothetical protein